MKYHILVIEQEQTLNFCHYINKNIFQKQSNCDQDIKKHVNLSKTEKENFSRFQYFFSYTCRRKKKKQCNFKKMTNVTRATKHITKLNALKLELMKTIVIR